MQFGKSKYYEADILLELWQEPPDRGVPLLVVTSAAFQLLLYCVKRFRDRLIRDRISNYMNDLRSTLVENVVNVYGIIIILVVSFFSVVFVSKHLTTIKGNSSKAAGELTAILPSTIVLLLCVMAFASGLPFFTRHALRCDAQSHHQQRLPQRQPQRRSQVLHLHFWVLVSIY